MNCTTSKRKGWRVYRSHNASKFQHDQNKRSEIKVDTYISVTKWSWLEFGSGDKQLYEYIQHTLLLYTAHYFRKLAENGSDHVKVAEKESVPDRGASLRFSSHQHSWDDAGISRIPNASYSRVNGARCIPLMSCRLHYCWFGRKVQYILHPNPHSSSRYRLALVSRLQIARSAFLHLKDWTSPRTTRRVRRVNSQGELAEWFWFTRFRYQEVR